MPLLHCLLLIDRRDSELVLERTMRDVIRCCYRLKGFLQQKILFVPFSSLPK